MPMTIQCHDGKVVAQSVNQHPATTVGSGGALVAQADGLFTITSGAQSQSDADFHAALAHLQRSQPSQISQTVGTTFWSVSQMPPLLTCTPVQPVSARRVGKKMRWRKRIAIQQHVCGTGRAYPCCHEQPHGAKISVPAKSNKQIKRERKQRERRQREQNEISGEVSDCFLICVACEVPTLAVLAHKDQTLLADLVPAPISGDLEACHEGSSVHAESCGSGSGERQLALGTPLSKNVTDRILTGIWGPTE